MWQFERKNKFKHQFKELSSETRERVRNALKQLADAEDPTALGIYKPLLGVYAFELGRADRILYSVRFNDNVIELIRVGDHKMVYGKD